MPPKKRGRKPKPKPTEPVVKPPPKKRGRKPKGGKIIPQKKVNKIIKKEEKPNIILHLKCSSDSLLDNKNLLDTENDKVKSFNIKSNTKVSNLNFNEIKDNIIKSNNNNNTNILSSNNENKTDESKSLKQIWEKLHKLKQNLKINNVSDKKSACFWCTYKFDNPAIYIPKCYVNNNIEVYGCFCSPQCAVSYLKNENIDNSTRWERYSLLNNIYSAIYEYKKNIKPAPNPFYTLDKYYGNLDILEYRKLLNNQTLLMVVNKPMTKITPEIYEDNNEIPDVFNNLLDNKVNKTKNNSYRLQRKPSTITKNSILANSIFNIN